MALSNDAATDATGTVVGDPTEVALCEAARDAGFAKAALGERYQRVAEIPFDSDRKGMTTVHRDPARGFVSFTKGAVEVILDKSLRLLTSSGPSAIQRNDLLKVSERMAGDGLRVLAL